MFFLLILRDLIDSELNLKSNAVSIQCWLPLRIAKARMLHRTARKIATQKNQLSACVANTMPIMDTVRDKVAGGSCICSEQCSLNMCGHFD